MNIDDKNNKDLKINYNKLTYGAMKNVLYEVLRSVSKNGLPGKHHFYISFKTNVNGVKIPKDLKTEYPEEMTIVIENYFWKLEVDKDKFSLILTFNKIKKKLVITFDSILSFSDPHANFIFKLPKISEEKKLFDKTKNKKSSKIINIHDFKKES
tara:strand:+ start:38913 stop:39374 length:462 start_codon:yes stop_codon:yes gene_type:complete